MQFRQRLKEDDSAVSPVIGVILMVAITVILAAVIASFVLGLGPDTATTPTASFSSEVTDDGTNDVLRITMSSGDTIDADSIEFVGENTNSNGEVEDGQSWADDSSAPTEITAGTSTTIGLDDTDDYEVTLVYVEGDTTSTLTTFDS